MLDLDFGSHVIESDVLIMYSREVLPRSAAVTVRKDVRGVDGRGSLGAVGVDCAVSSSILGTVGLC